MNDRRRISDRLGGDAFAADRFWEDAERLIDRMEKASTSVDPRTESSLGQFYRDIVIGLRQASDADTVRLQVGEDDAWNVLAEEGIAIHHEGADGSDDRLSVRVPVLDQTRLELEAKFDVAVAIAHRRATEQLITALADLTMQVLLKSKLAVAADQLQNQDRRDTFLTRLYHGADLTDTFASISAELCQQVLVDRVSLLRFQSGRYRWVASSTQSKIDRRATQVRLLETLAGQCLAGAKRFSFEVGGSGSGDVAWDVALHRYIDESGCRAIHIESILDRDNPIPVAAIVMEQFSWKENVPEKLSASWLPVRDVVGDAVVQAVRRDESVLPSLFGRFGRAATRRKLAAIGGASAVLAALACVPVSFAIPAEGRIVAANQSRIFSPTQGVVVEVLVADGEEVRAGQALVVLRSPDLDMEMQSLAAELETSRVKLDSLSVLRSAGRDTTTSADEQILQAEMLGLQQQLDLIESQQNELTVESPIDGVVDHWDLSDALATRPVRHGQHLLTVISRSSGWTADLEVPDQAVGYVLQAQTEEPSTCSVKLRSNPTEVFTGKVSKVSGVADINESGQSVVHIAVPLDVRLGQTMRQGSTVVANIRCGTRSAGFVYLRSVIEWCRRQSWL